MGYGVTLGVGRWWVGVGRRVKRSLFLRDCFWLGVVVWFFGVAVGCGWGLFVRDCFYAAQPHHWVGKETVVNER